ncbi:MAG: prepilin-type N-terminal cleavage/methylation domain-containing protein, partial [Lentisphaeria bacterium]
MKLVKNMFTLIELIIVIAIIGTLTLLIMPEMQQNEEDAAATVSTYNSKALARTLSNYKAANGMYPTRFNTGL